MNNWRNVYKDNAWKLYIDFSNEIQVPYIQVFLIKKQDLSKM